MIGLRPETAQRDAARNAPYVRLQQELPEDSE